MSLRSPASDKPRPGGQIAWPRVAIYVALTAGALVAVAPFLYMLTTSVKSLGSVIAGRMWPWPPMGDEAIQWGNYLEAIRRTGFDKDWGMLLFYRYAVNSIIVTLATVAGVLITSVLAAYALAQMNVPGKEFLFVLLLATLMIPSDLTIVPQVVMMFQLKWYNTYLALIVPFLASVFGIFLLRQFFMQIPKDLFDAALIDGSGHVRYLFTIVMPLSKPALVSVALINFIWAWDSFKWPLLVTRDSNMRVLAVGLQQFLVGEGGTNIHLMMAFSAMVTVPVIIFYFFTQKYFTEGITTTGIKG
jgi:ABC-type glycerol-3-phosphate transport system permease component